MAFFSTFPEKPVIEFSLFGGHMDVKLGQFISDAGQRDAIHVAVAPVVAAEDLKPGDRLVFAVVGDAEHVRKAKKGEIAIGIVDPFFLPHERIWHDSRFWMLLLPNTITSLRHLWAHPAFGDTLVGVDASQRWIEAFAVELDQTYNRLMDAARLWIAGERQGHEWNDGYTYDNTEAYRDVAEEKWPLFWHHYEVVTGTAPKEKGSFFACSC